MGIMDLNPTFGLDFFFVMCKYVNSCASLQANMPDIWLINGFRIHYEQQQVTVPDLLRHGENILTLFCEKM
jgi:hypothetical protein